MTSTPPRISDRWLHCLHVPPSCPQLSVLVFYPRRPQRDKGLRFCTERRPQVAGQRGDLPDRPGEGLGLLLLLWSTLGTYSSGEGPGAGMSLGAGLDPKTSLLTPVPQASFSLGARKTALPSPFASVFGSLP